MNNIPIPTFEDNVANRERAKIILEKCKEYERKAKLFSLNIGKSTVVYCNNEQRLEEYKKLLK